MAPPHSHVVGIFAFYTHSCQHLHSRAAFNHSILFCFFSLQNQNENFCSNFAGVGVIVGIQYVCGANIPIFSWLDQWQKVRCYDIWHQRHTRFAKVRISQLILHASKKKRLLNILVIIFPGNFCWIVLSTRHCQFISSPMTSHRQYSWTIRVANTRKQNTPAMNALATIRHYLYSIQIHTFNAIDNIQR